MLSYRVSVLSAVIVTIFVWSLSFTAHAIKDSDPRARLRKSNVSAIVIHAIGGPKCEGDKVVFTGSRGDAAKWKQFFEDSNDKSIHYIIDRDGNLASSLSENRVAWHAVGMNEKSIGIELTNNGDGVEEFPQAMIDRLRTLIRDIKTRHPEITNDHIYMHSDVDNSTFPCAGKQERRKRDPGPKFPFKELIDSL
jgi:N-acetyl-anhydromuramyl-L-alanine amidase AmpD